MQFTAAVVEVLTTTPFLHEGSTPFGQVLTEMCSTILAATKTIIKSTIALEVAIPARVVV